jgi:ATP-dependent HslUV protease ATP-binding subunit HslU
MTTATLTINSRNYGAWSLRGWLLCRLAGLEFTEEAVSEIARFAYLVNTQTENIGARRLFTVMEKLLDEISFEAPDLRKKEITIDADYVRRCWRRLPEQDLSRYILRT